MSIAAWKYFTHQTEWKAYLQDLVSNSDTALLRAIVIIDNRQTEEERKNKQSTEDNNVGWTKHDAKDMGEIAAKVRSNVQLSNGELAMSRNRMKKYWKQLMVVSKVQQEQKKQQELAEVKEKQQKIQESKELQFRQHNEMLRQCSENGKQCEYGICSECPVTQGLQMRMSFGGANE